MKKIKIIFIHNYLRCCKISKGIVPIVPISVITSISLKLHRPSTIPDQLRIGSQSKKCQEMIEWKQQVLELPRPDVETTQKNPREELINISSILKKEYSSKFPHRIDVLICTWIRLSKSMKSRGNFLVEFRRRIDGKSTTMSPLG